MVIPYSTALVSNEPLDEFQESHGLDLAMKYGWDISREKPESPRRIIETDTWTWPCPGIEPDRHVALLAGNEYGLWGIREVSNLAGNDSYFWRRTNGPRPGNVSLALAVLLCTGDPCKNLDTRIAALEPHHR